MGRLMIRVSSEALKAVLVDKVELCAGFARFYVDRADDMRKHDAAPVHDERVPNWEQLVLADEAKAHYYECKEIVFRSLLNGLDEGDDEYSIDLYGCKMLGLFDIYD